MESLHTTDAVRARLAEDAANGKTVVLSTRELDDPTLREQLPQMLEELSQQHQSTSGGPMLPGYTMLGEIGQGGMSTVYLARHDALGRHVAVKVSPKWLGGDRARERLVQEARAMARVQHNNIVVIHDIIDVDDTFAIAMEWIDGRTLASLMRSLPGEPHEHDMTILCAALGVSDEQREELEQTTTRHFVKLIHDIACATHAVHEAGLLHLDIKPSNVLVRRDGTPLLADFGVVREISTELTQTRTFAGTPIYSAPEQLRREDSKIGPHSDVYSLGLTLYEALARSQPLRALDLPGIVECVESGRMPRLSEKTAVTADLENIVHKAIAPEPENRYASAAEFADDLLAFLEYRPVKARPLSRGQRLRRWMRNEPWKAALAATLAIMLPVLGSLGTYLVMQMPAIERAAAEKNLEQANRLKQEVYQRWLIKKLGGKRAIRILEQAMDLDPGDTSLACLLALANEQGWEVLDQTIAKHREQMDRSVGLRLVAKKAKERRSFFTDEEVARLKGDVQSIDRYVLALDRVFRTQDHPTPKYLDQVVRALESAMADRAPDPLLIGLLTWYSQMAGDGERYESAVQTMKSVWPNEAVLLAWAPLSIESFDYEEAHRRTMEIIASTPDQARGYEILCGGLIRQRRFDEVDAVIERARQNGVTETMKSFDLLSRATAGDGDASKAFLGQFEPGELTASMEIKLLAKIDDKLPEQRKQQILAAPSPSAEMLSSVMWASDKNSEESNRAWERLRELFPDRFGRHGQRMHTMFTRRDVRSAADVAMQMLPDLRSIHPLVDLSVRALMYAREWEHMERHAQHWLDHGSELDEGSYFHGIASLRQGKYVQAAQSLAFAIHKATETAWYPDALLADAWLRCSPDCPAELRDVGLAKARIEQFEKLNEKLERPHAGPWTQLVRAEVLFANGDQEGAIAAARRGLQRRLRRETHAPANYRAQLQAALERFMK